MSILKPGLAERYERVKQSLTDDESRCGRKPGSVFLLPVSKTFGIEALEEAVKCGMRTFGENYVQEGCEKIEYFKKMHPELAITWHFIGHLQSNKTRPVAEHFDWVQTVDRLKIAQRLSEQRPADMPPLNVLIEVHISDEESKSGCQPADVPALAQAITLLPNLKLRGIMAIPAPSDNEEGKKAPLKEMYAIFLHLRDELNFDIDTLSMGMSADMAEAVEDAFRYGKLVLATITYNADIFPFMKTYIDHLTERNYQNRTIGLIENGSWASMAGKVMTGMFEKSKNITWLETSVKIMSSMDEQNKADIEKMAEELM